MEIDVLILASLIYRSLVDSEAPADSLVFARRLGIVPRCVEVQGGSPTVRAEETL